MTKNVFVDGIFVKKIKVIGELRKKWVEIPKSFSILGCNHPFLKVLYKF